MSTHTRIYDGWLEWPIEQDGYDCVTRCGKCNGGLYIEENTVQGMIDAVEKHATNECPEFKGI